MISDSPISLSVPTNQSNLSLVNQYAQIRLKVEGDKVLLILPGTDQSKSPSEWSEAWHELKHRLQASERSWQPQTPVHLLAKDQLLDARQLQTIAEALLEIDLRITWVTTSRRQTAVAAATAGYSVEQKSVDQHLLGDISSPATTLAEPLYLQTTVRSGVEVRHPGTVIICGDLNPGGTVIAAGDILVWGRLRGLAHAGAQGNRECRIFALEMQPTQLRIAELVARAPESPEDLEPEIAYIAKDGIRLTKALNFTKSYTFVKEVGGWLDSVDAQASES